MICNFRGGNWFLLMLSSDIAKVDDGMEEAQLILSSAQLTLADLGENFEVASLIWNAYRGCSFSHI